MSLPQVISGAGGKGGSSKAHTPVEAPNTLRSRAIARLIDVISEGEIAGLVDQTDKLKCVYVDDVPVQNADGTYNFEGITIHERYGLPTQDPVPGFSEVESEITVNSQVKDAAPVLFTITDTDIDAIRLKMRVPALYDQTDKGDLLGTTLTFKVEVQPAAGSFTTVITDTIDGKTTSQYERQHRIALADLGTFPLTFRVSRITPDSTEANKQNELYVNSYTEIQEVKLTYPDSALIALEVDSELFSGRVPRRSYLVNGIKIKVPSNYDPETREYTGFWDGTFQTAWSNNPAWVLYDILTNERYGLGEFILPAQVDKFALYQIGQYCDELVDDGFGGTEPRFVFNGVIAERREAFEVINAIVSAFRGMAYWSAGGITAVHDAPRDATRLVGPANVVGGEFSYSGTGLKSRHTAALVTWNDPVNNYKQAVEVVEDPNLIDRYGWRPIEVVAFACTSQGQANRLGRWILDSEANETETLTFTAGFDFADVRPGEIIKVNDPARAGVRRAGRIRSASIRSLLPVTDPDQAWDSGTDDIPTVATWSGGGIARGDNALFHCRIKVPSTALPTGCVFEAGKNNTGLYLGFDASGNLILRAGDGANPINAATGVRLQVPNARIETDRELDIICDVQVNPGRCRLWINNQFMGQAGTDGGGSLEGGQLCGTEDGGFGATSGEVVAGEVATVFNGEITSQLSYWHDRQADTILSDFTLSDSFLPGETINSAASWSGSGIDRNNSGLVAFAFATPSDSTPPLGCLWELGKNERGTYCGFDGNGDLIIRMGDGSATMNPAKMARMVIPGTEFTAGQSVHLIIDWTPSIGRFRVWKNWQWYGEAQTTGGVAFVNSEIAGSNAGSFGEIYDETVDGETGAIEGAFNGTLQSVLDYYRVSQIDDHGAAGTITLDAAHTVLADDVLYLVAADMGIDSLTMQVGTATAEVTLLSMPSKTPRPNAMYLIQGANLHPEQWRVISMRESEPHKFEVTALRYDPTKFARVEEGIVIDPPPTSFLPTGAAQPPSNLSIRESLYKTNSGVNTRVDIFWTASPDPRVTLYRTEARGPDGQWRTISVGPHLHSQIPNAQAGLWSFKVTAIKGGELAGSESSAVSLTDQNIIGKSEPPGDVTGLTAVRSYTSVTLTWDAVTDLDLVGYEIRQGSLWDDSTLVAANHVSTQIVIPVTTTEDVTYLVKAVDELTIYSTTVASVTAAAIPPDDVTGFYIYQIGSEIRAVWDQQNSASVIRYELRYGSTTDDWESSAPLGEATTNHWQGAFSVSTSTTFRFRVKPFVQFASGNRSYGDETTFDREIHPRINQNIVKTQAEHSSWAGTLSAEMEVVSGELRLKANETFGTYTYEFDLTSEQFGRMWYEHAPLLIANDEPEIDDYSAVEINDMTDSIGGMAYNGIPQISYVLEFADEVPFLEADYKFTTVNVRVEFRRGATDATRPALSALTTFFDLPDNMA